MPEAWQVAHCTVVSFVIDVSDVAAGIGVAAIAVKAALAKAAGVWVFLFG